MALTATINTGVKMTAKRASGINNKRNSDMIDSPNEKVILTND